MFSVVRRRVCFCYKWKTWRGIRSFALLLSVLPTSNICIYFPNSPKWLICICLVLWVTFHFLTLQVAIKSIRKDKIKDEQDMVHIRREIEIMSSLNHPHIISIYEGQWFFFFFSSSYQLPFLIPWGLPRFLGNCPTGQEPSIFPHDAKIAGC